MIYTSYFAQMRNFPENVIPISICAKPPVWYKGLQYKKLAPSYDILMNYKAVPDEENYIRRYKKEILEQININDVLMDLYWLIPEDIRKQLSEVGGVWYEHPDIHIALLCFEKPSDFCHRHLVADWFRESGIEISEWTKERENEKEPEL